MSQSDIGKKIAELRKQKGFSQDGLAYLCKMNVRSIQRIEAGQVQPRPYTLKILTEALDYNFLNEYHASSTKITLTNVIQNIITKIATFWNYKGENDMQNESILKQLTRSHQDRTIAGICGGLGEHTCIPAWLWRIIFIASAFIYGIGLVLYVLFWIFMPQDKMQSEQNYSHKNNWLNQLTKSTTDKKIAGICGGLGDSTSVPSWCWRIMFVASSLIYGLGLVLYILLWIFMPGAKPADQKNLSFA